MIFSSNLLYSLHFINFHSTLCNNLQSDIIYSPTLGTSADVPDVPCPTPLSLRTNKDNAHARIGCAQLVALAESCAQLAIFLERTLLPTVQ